MSRPKTLAERLEWMSANLPGFADELESVRVIQERAEIKALELRTNFAKEIPQFYTSAFIPASSELSQ